MTKALEEEVKRLDEEEASTEGEVKEEVEEQEETSEEEGEDEEEAKSEEQEKKEEQYRERQKAKREEQAKQVVENVEEAENADDPGEMAALKAKVAQFDKVVQNQQFNVRVKQAEKELNGLETEFKAVFTDYDSVVDDALELSKIRLVANGATDGEADDYLRREKVLLADKAASRGKDPVEAVYKEAQQILSVFDTYAEKKGYVKSGKPKTNLQSMREINKPNAMTGGAGRGANAGKTSFSELGQEDLEEIQNTNIWELGK